MDVVVPHCLSLALTGSGHLKKIFFGIVGNNREYLETDGNGQSVHKAGAVNPKTGLAAICLPVEQGAPN